MNIKDKDAFLFLFLNPIYYPVIWNHKCEEILQEIIFL